MPPRGPSVLACGGQLAAPWWRTRPTTSPPSSWLVDMAQEACGGSRAPSLPPEGFARLGEKLQDALRGQLGPALQQTLELLEEGARLFGVAQ